MDIKFIKSGTRWNNQMSPKKIFERDYNPSIFLLNNIKGKETIEQPLQGVLDALYSQYSCIFKFKDHGYNNNHIFVGRTLCWRGHRDGRIMYSESVKLIDGIEDRFGGSLKHPAPTFKGNTCTLEFISNGIPHLIDTDGWKVEEVIKFERL